MSKKKPRGTPPPKKKTKKTKTKQNKKPKELSSVSDKTKK